MSVLLSFVLIALGTVSLVLAVSNTIQEDKNIVENWYVLFLGLSSFIWDFGMAMFTIQTKVENAVFWRKFYLIGAFGLIVMSGVIGGTWVGIPSRLKKIADTYYIFGALIVYPILSVSEACVFVHTDYGM